jgi:hypothetical protein
MVHNLANTRNCHLYIVNVQPDDDNRSYPNILNHNEVNRVAQVSSSWCSLADVLHNAKQMIDNNQFDDKSKTRCANRRLGYIGKHRRAHNQTNIDID